MGGNGLKSASGASELRALLVRLRGFLLFFLSLIVLSNSILVDVVKRGPNNANQWSGQTRKNHQWSRQDPKTMPKTAAQLCSVSGIGDRKVGKGVRMFDKCVLTLVPACRNLSEADTMGKSLNRKIQLEYI